MDDMPRPRDPYLHHEKTRHGQWVWYYRPSKASRRIRINAKFGTPEFREAVEEAKQGRKIDPKKPISGSFDWLVKEYRTTCGAWKNLSLSTRHKYELILENMLKDTRDVAFATVNQQTIVGAMDRRAETPFQANNFLKAVKGLFKWAVLKGHMKADPTLGVKPLPTKTTGFHAWTENELEAFEKKHKIGTRERLAFDILLYTGLRRGDAARLGPEHVRNGIFTIETEKTGVIIVAPILPKLAKSIQATKIGKTTFIIGERGEAMTKEGFGNWFGKVCADMGLPGSAHGLRKAGATRAANNGATVAQLEAIFGWHGGGMASHYTRNSNRGKLAREAMSKLSEESEEKSYTRTEEYGKGKDAENSDESTP
jgi:integrase